MVTQPNQGAAAARNKAFSQSRGDYIQWLDADDLFLVSGKIQKQLEALGGRGRKRTLLSSAWGRFWYRHERASSRRPRCGGCRRRNGCCNKLDQNLYMQTATWLVSRELTEKAGPWDTRLLSDDDQEYFCRVLLASDGVRFVPEAKVYYRVSGPGSLSYIGTSDRKREAHWRSLQLHVDYIRSLEDSERVRAAVCGTSKTGCLFSIRNGSIYSAKLRNYPEPWADNWKRRACPGNTPGLGSIRMASCAPRAMVFAKTQVVVGEALGQNAFSDRTPKTLGQCLQYWKCESPTSASNTGRRSDRPWPGGRQSRSCF